MKFIPKFLGAVFVLFLIAMVVTGCGHRPQVNAKYDETVCVYDGSERGSQKFKFQVFPGENPKSADNNDLEVILPASNRFYAASRNRRVADVNAPNFYIAYTNQNVPVEVEGQFRFKFKLDAACDWYAKHGRRNATEEEGDTLDFNGRGTEPPWVKWLNENFGAIATQVIKSNSRDFTWQELVYGVDPEARERAEAVDVEYGKTIGREFTQRLNTSLGGQFFCGTDASVWGDNADISPDCPPIYFETREANSADRLLMQRKQANERIRNNLEAEKAEAELKAARAEGLLRAEQVDQKILQEQIKTARLRAQADVETQKCLLLAEKGLDCSGKHPTVVVGSR